MSRNGKIILGIVAVLVLMCICGVMSVFGLLAAVGNTIYQAVETSPAAISVSSGSIADFELPTGYKPEAAVNFGGFHFVSYTPGDGHSHIMFVQASPSVHVDTATLEQYAQQAEENRGYNARARNRVVEHKQVTIRGQAVTLVIGEGVNSAGQAYRTMSGTFQGRGGPAFVGVEQPVSRWNQAEVDAFLASIR